MEKLVKKELVKLELKLHHLISISNSREAKDAYGYCINELKLIEEQVLIK